MALTYDEAAHVYRRLGFGATPAEIEALAARGRDGAVDYVINYDQIDNSAMEQVLERSFNFSNPAENQLFNQNELRRWWFTRIVLTRRQFEEKMTLFWHNHFATALSKVPDLLMYIQNSQVLRPHALDRFDTLLLRVAQDPAMLIWLDNITNVKGNANENWARELQELFTMGIVDVVTGEPNYTEDDVKEISRAFTGWKFRRPPRNQPFGYSFVVIPNEHDNTAKTIYGQTANFSGEDVITIVSARRSTARYLVKRFFDFFVYPLADSAEEKATIEKFADVYVSSNHSIKELARAIFTSDEFFGARARFALVKNPVELIAGSLRMLGASYTPGALEDSGGRGRRDTSLYVSSRLMGMDLFNPPDVNGWGMTLEWINTATLLNRYNFTNAFMTSRNPDNPGAYVSSEQLSKYTHSNPKKTVKKFLKTLGPLEVDGKTVKTLRDYLRTDDLGNKVEFVVNNSTIDKKVRGLVHQIMSLPEYQLS